MTKIDPAYVSCDARKLYGIRNFPGPEDERLTVEQAAVAGEFVGELYHPYEYQRPLNLDHIDASPHFMGALAESRARINAGPTGAASALFLLPRAIIRDRVVYLDDNALFPVIYETHRPIDRANSSLATQAELQAALPLGATDDPILFLGSSGCFNYGHVLVDDLTRLSAFWKIREQHPDRKITVLMTSHAEDIDRVKTESIKFLLSEDKNFSVELIPRPLAFKVSNLYYPTPTTVHSTLKSPEALIGLRDHTLRLLEANARKLSILPESRPKRRLFIDRGPLHTRRLINGPEIFAALEPLGFEKQTLDKLTFEEQASMFADASIVVGNMGAGMTNTVFCQPGTPILYLVPEGWDEPFYWDLAAVLDHVHYALYGLSDGEPFKGGFTIELAKVMDKVNGFIRDV